VVAGFWSRGPPSTGSAAIAFIAVSRSAETPAWKNGLASRAMAASGVFLVST
jgi:hypothetical protein